jgi:transcriptional regulator with XRE-family HTH domain
MEGFGERLLIARKRKKFTQGKLAELLEDGSKSTISNWENGTSKPTLETVLKVSQILEVSIDWLLTGKESAKLSAVPESQIIIPREEYMEYLKLKNEKLEKENAGLKSAGEHATKH